MKTPSTRATSKTGKVFIKVKVSNAERDTTVERTAVNGKKMNC